MEAVKRAKPVQKKIVHNIFPVLFANTDAFSIRRVKELLSANISLLAAPFGGIFIHRSLQKSSELHTGIPLAIFPGKRRPQGIILEIRKQKGGNSS
jgi:hypothetical protein